nr:MAG TPA: hypothetical protein [Caudoviricetes sp.]
MNKSFLKKLLTFQCNSDIINNVKRTDNSLLSPPFLHIERLTGRFAEHFQRVRLPLCQFVDGR